MKRLVYPFTEKAVRELRAGEEVLISGQIVTGRDRLHKYLFEGGHSPVSLKDGAIYHCGPVVTPDGSRIIAAGPTTSSREEPYTPDVIRKQGVRVIIGKGGMGRQTLEACAEYGCVYLQTVGGAAALLAKSVTAVKGVCFLDDFRSAEAMWILEVKNMPAVVGMDTHRTSLFEQIREKSFYNLSKLI